MTFTTTTKFTTPNIPFEIGMCYEVNTPWMGNPTHPGCILDINGDYILTFFFSTTPMSKHYKGWEDQQIFPKGEGGKTKSTWGMPNQTLWIHSSYFIKTKNYFSPYYIDQMYSEIEKFFDGIFEEIELPIKNPTRIITRI